eukprot:4541430-Alexandrium_andersonii.AAC.1
MDRLLRRRPNRTALARREQHGRAHGRAVQLLLREFALIQQHRGGQFSRPGEALRRALSVNPGPSVASAPASRDEVDSDGP